MLFFSFTLMHGAQGAKKFQNIFGHFLLFFFSIFFLNQKKFWSLFTVLFFDFFFVPKKILVTFYCSFFQFFVLHQKQFWSLFSAFFSIVFFGPLSKNGFRNGRERLVKALEHFISKFGSQST